jgi:DNA-binding NarL/FixJ family response regulator
MNAMEQLLQIGSALNVPQRRARRVIRPRSAEVPTGLTRRMMDLAPLLVQGMRLKGIGLALGITEGRVKVLVSQMYRRVGVGGRWEFLNWWSLSGLGQDSSRVFSGVGSDVVKMGAFE